jgi:DNA-directed RNA polymerase I subunit RPA2
MVRSNRCHLTGLTPSELVRRREEANELGGYFVVNGNEKVVRLLQVPRRNFAAAVTRSSYKKRGAGFSDKGVSMRCARRDQTTLTVTLHYLTNGDARLRFAIRKQEFLVPVVIMLRALCAVTDRELYERALAGDDENTFLSARLEVGSRLIHGRKRVHA